MRPPSLGQRYHAISLASRPKASYIASNIPTFNHASPSQGTPRRITPLVLRSDSTPNPPVTTEEAFYPTPPPSATTMDPIFTTPLTAEVQDEYSDSGSSSDEVWQSFSSQSVSSSMEHMEQRDLSPSAALKARGRADTEDEDEDGDESEDPFLYDRMLPISSIAESISDTAVTRSAADVVRSRLLHRASLTPLPPAEGQVQPRRFSLMRDRTTDETVFVQEISDAEGRRWSLRVPASGLPGDMVRMLEELETIAQDLRQTLPTIVVTQSSQSVGQSVLVDLLQTDEGLIKSPALLQPPPQLDGFDCDGEDEVEIKPQSLVAKEKARALEPEVEVALPPAATLPSEPSLTCIYLPSLAPEFLTGSSTSFITEPAFGFHSKAPPPAPRKSTAFFSALKPPTPSRLAKPTGIPRGKALPPKSALPVFKNQAPLTTSPPSKSVLGSPSALVISPTRLQSPKSRSVFGSTGPGSAVLAKCASTPPTGLPRPKPSLLEGLYNKAKASPTPVRPPNSGIKSLFRRPAQRSASEPPPYIPPVEGKSILVRPRPVSYVFVPPPVLEPRRMPRLPSARDLIRKLR
ncbi:hypothetical protein BV25DRAFT_774644 [Artomyces pyxidatus]|uniref:Uncharacterized protein n=1 Tax=Artomyces pyxidatus TaxID=48021 RepID=A0ACB8SZK5_9AGAM|nr:hypothetical protein BV25DRAFT_774644 [Artomyces pyxidatus]